MLFSWILWQGLFFNSPIIKMNKLLCDIICYVSTTQHLSFHSESFTIPLQTKVTNLITYAKTQSQIKSVWLPGPQCSDAMTSDGRERVWSRDGWILPVESSAIRGRIGQANFSYCCSQKWPSLMIAVVTRIKEYHVKGQRAIQSGFREHWQRPKTISGRIFQHSEISLLSYIAPLSSIVSSQHWRVQFLVFNYTEDFI